MAPPASTETAIALLTGIVLLVLFGGLRAWRQARALRRRRAAYEASHHAAAIEPHVEALVVQAYAVLGRDCLAQPELRGSELAGVPPTERLDAAVTLCASRFGIARGTVAATYSRELPPGVGADVAGEAPFEAIRAPGGLTLRRGTQPTQWRIRVAVEAAADDAVLLAFVGHEMAHVALRSRGVWLEDWAQNELLTEVAAVLAGFGALMRHSAYREYWSGRVTGGVDVATSQGGYLHQFTIDYLMRRRMELSASSTGATQPHQATKGAT